MISIHDFDLKDLEKRGWKAKLVYNKKLDTYSLDAEKDGKSHGVDFSLSKDFPDESSIKTAAYTLSSYCDWRDNKAN